MQTKVERDGDELLVTIPQQFLDRAGLKIGDEIEITGDARQIEIKPVNRESDD